MRGEEGVSGKGKWGKGGREGGRSSDDGGREVKETRSHGVLRASDHRANRRV